jgi:3',5'-cyclic AMP phosphodiesterase CpdA
VMGDTGRGDRAQYDTANEMARWRQRFDFRHVLMLGDNIYGGFGTAEAYAARFERPYKALTEAGVVFHAVLGNHDPPGQTEYPPFNMNGHRYYSFTLQEGPLPIGKQQIAFFALDSITLDEDQLAWLDRELGATKAAWKICFYHHPLYTSGEYSVSSVMTRRALEPIFVCHGVEVGFSGHEHFYERIVPQRGVQYFTSGSGGALRSGAIRRTSLTSAGFDRDNEFMLIEISGDSLYFQVISRTGQTVDAGQVQLRARTPVP